MTAATTGLPRAQALIMAGGRGERLYPLTVSRPKPAVPFGGVFRLIDFPLLNCLNSGISRVSLLTQYKHEELQAYIRQGWSERWKRMKREALACLPPGGGRHYRGTADAVFQNIAMLQSDKPEFVLILSSDHVYRMDYGALLRSHAETDADLTIAAVEHPLRDATHFGVVEVDNKQRVIGFQEKPSLPRPMPARPDTALVSMGVYAFKREVLIQALIDQCDRENGYDFGRHVIPSLIRSARTYAYDFRDETRGSPHYWRDIGTLDSYYETSMDLVGPRAPFDPYTGGNWPSRPAPHRGLNAHLRTNCCVSLSVLSPGVRIEEGSSVEHSVLMPGVWIGKGARIRRVIVEEGVHVPAGFQIGFDLEYDRERYLVTDAGVVVVTAMPKYERPIAVYSTPRNGTHATMKSTERRKRLRLVA